MNSETRLILGALIVTLTSTGVWCQCSKQDYQHCVKLADPLLRDPHLIYPDNARDIEHVCRSWTFFVECVKKYTDRCFTEARKNEFNKAVEMPVSSIHKLCSMPDYRQDYLKHAGCMKMTLTMDSHCGRHYRLLVGQVSGEAATASVCCSHHMLRECVVDQARASCDPDSAPFSAAMLDKAMSFLKDQCSNFIPNQLDCPGADFYRTTGRSETRLMVDGTSTKTTLAATQQTSATSGTRRTSPQPAPTPASDSRSSPSTRGETETYGSWSPIGVTPTQESDQSRTSRGRGMTWSRTPFGSTPTSPSTWRVSTSDLWLPSSRAPSMIDNAIDEPNQQGLGSESSASVQGISIVLIFSTLLGIIR